MMHDENMQSSTAVTAVVVIVNVALFCCRLGGSSKLCHGRWSAKNSIEIGWRYA